MDGCCVSRRTAGAVDGLQAAGYFLVTAQVTGDDLDGLPLVACN
jgi:hypothetical protein